MSESYKLRKENNCLNCGAEVTGKYCSKCGQLNRVPQMQVSDLFHEVLHSIIHFDGKFFETTKLLITRPGFLTTEYISGKRSKYLPPVQMYLFTSAIFFFLLNTFFLEPPNPEQETSAPDKQKIENSIKVDFSGSNKNFESVEAYIQTQHSLPEAKRDGFLKRYVKTQEIRINKKFKENPRKAFTELMDNFIHSFSSLLFVSLPLMTIWFKLIFFKRKEFNLVDHFIFIAHNYIFCYVTMFLNVILKSPASINGLAFIENIAMLVFIWILYYGYKSMKIVYQLTRRQAIWKFGLTLTGSLFIFSFLFIIYLFLSLLKIQ